MARAGHAAASQRRQGCGIAGTPSGRMSISTARELLLLHCSEGEPQKHSRDLLSYWKVQVQCQRNTALVPIKYCFITGLYCSRCLAVAGQFIDSCTRVCLQAQLVEAACEKSIQPERERKGEGGRRGSPVSVPDPSTLGSALHLSITSLCSVHPAPSLVPPPTVLPHRAVCE